MKRCSRNILGRKMSGWTAFLLGAGLLVSNLWKALGTTPLCDLCPCNSKPNEPPYINCQLDALSQIYDESYWLNRIKNESYPIASLRISLRNETVQDKLPSSDLKLLDLSENRFKDLPEGFFCDLQKMQVLVLAGNLLERINPETFRGKYFKDEYFPLRSLKKLDLSENRLVSLDSDVFEHIDSLDVLILKGNPLGNIDAATSTAISGLVYLTVLDLASTGIGSLPENLLFSAKVLKDLDLSGNEFDAVPAQLADSQTLEKVVLDDNPLRNLGIFPRVETLRALHLSRLPFIHEVCRGAFGNLNNLRELYLSENPSLSYVHPRMAEREGGTGLRRLQRLHLGANNLSFVDEEVFLDLKVVEDVDLSGNPLVCACQNRWIVDDLVPHSLKHNIQNTLQTRCDSPQQFKNQTLEMLYRNGVVLECLDDEGDIGQYSLVMIGIIFGILTLILFVLLLAYSFRSKIQASHFSYRHLSGTASSRV